MKLNKEESKKLGIKVFHTDAAKEELKKTVKKTLKEDGPKSNDGDKNDFMRDE